MKRPETLVDRLRQSGKVDAISAAEALDDSFIDHLVSEFTLPDRVDLIEAIELAAYAYEGSSVFGQMQRDWRRQEADLFDAIQRTLSLCHEMRSPIAEHLARDCPEEFGETPERAGSRLDELMRSLSLVGQAAGLEPRFRDDGRGRKAKAALRSTVGVLRDYWVYKVGRKFTQNQDWPKGAQGDEPPTEATRFAYVVIEFLAPGQGKHLKTVSKEFTKIPPLSAP